LDDRISHSINEAEVQGFGRGEPPGCGKEVKRTRFPDQPRKSLRPAPACDDSQADKGKNKYKDSEPAGELK